MTKSLIGESPKYSVFRRRDLPRSLTVCMGYDQIEAPSLWCEPSGYEESLLAWRSQRRSRLGSLFILALTARLLPRLPYAARLPRSTPGTLRVGRCKMGARFPGRFGGVVIRSSTASRSERILFLTTASRGLVYMVPAANAASTEAFAFVCHHFKGRKMSAGRTARWWSSGTSLESCGD